MVAFRVELMILKHYNYDIINFLSENNQLYFIDFRYIYIVKYRSYKDKIIIPYF